MTREPVDEKHIVRAVLLCLVLTLAAQSGAEQHPNAVKGFDPNGVFHVNGFDTINAWNGNLTVSLPIGHEYSIGGGLTYQLRLYSNSNVWDSQSRDAELQDDLDGLDFPDCREPGSSIARACTHAFPDLSANAGMGWRLSLGHFSGSSYVSPDGSEHTFFQTLHRDLPDDGDATTLYTRDGTYLRLQGTGDRRTIEFPNGEIHTFSKYEIITPDQHTVGFRLEKIGNRFASNVLNVAYEPATGQYERIILSDGFRTHTIHLTPELPFESGISSIVAADPPMITTRRLIDHIDVAGFNGATARYQFVYDSVLVSRPGWHTIPETITPREAQVQQLKTLRLPDGSEFKFGYDTDFWSTGLLNKMTLPTGGWISWIYQIYEFPWYSAKTLNHMAETPGVAERRLYLPNQLPEDPPYAKWTYDQKLDGAFDVESQLPAESKTTIVDPVGTRTEHYFDISSLNQSSVKYGLPFTLKTTDGSGRYLSARVYPADRATPRETYVRYERDAPTDTASTTAPGDRHNVRESSTKTLNEDGTVFTVDRSNFDGLGHYRTVKEIVDGVVKKTTTVNYNPARGTYPGTFTVIPTASPWIAEVYDSVAITDGVSTLRSEYCFDSATGFLNRKRTLRNVPAGPQADLLAVFTPDPATGNMLQERYYGGDKTPLPGTFTWQCGSSLPATAAYTIDHVETRGINPATGLKERRRKSVYATHPFTIADVSVDESSDLPVSSRDASGVETKYSYDLVGRMTELRPAGSAWTQYVYPPNSGTVFPLKVLARQWAAGTAPVASSELGMSVYHFDGFGRLTQESRKIPGGWSRTRTLYDQLDRKVTQYSPVQASDATYVETVSGPSTSWAYDGSGRVTSITQPDGSSTRIRYQRLDGSTWVDSSRIRRTSTDVRTSVLSTNDTAVTIEEETDGFGRLVRVTEDADAGAPLRADTFYAYDLGDNLAKVTMGVQTRRFTFDGAGLLREEEHPESGKTLYTYDARGQVGSRTTPQSTLTYEYDTAQRLRKVFDAGLLLKEFKFYESGPAVGKLEWSLRNNRYDATTVPVKEIFTYDTTGRIAAKQTQIGQGPTFTDAYAYDELGAVREVTYPACSGCGDLVAPARKISTTREFGFTTAVPGYAKKIDYHANGLLKSIEHRNQDGTTGPVYQQTIDGGMARPAQISVSNVCSDLRISTQPPATFTAGSGITVLVTAQADGNPAWQWYERTALGEQAVSGQTTNVLSVAAVGKKVYFARISNGTCTVDSSTTIITAVSGCGVDASIETAEPVEAFATQTASVPDTPGATYSWSITGGWIVSPTSARTITFKAACGTTLKLTVVVTVGSCTTPNQRDVAVRQPTAQVTGSTSIPAQGEAELSVALTGIGPWTATWSDNVTGRYTSSTATRRVTPSQTTVYSITHLATDSGCDVENHGSSATVTVNAACTAPPPNAELSGEVEASYPASVRQSIWMPAQEGATFEWSVTNGRIHSAEGRRLEFIANCSGEVTISLTVTSQCGIEDSDTVTVPIRQGRAEILPENSSLVYIPGTAGVELKVNMTDSYAATVTWSDGAIEKTGIGLLGVYKRLVAPETRTTYSLIRASNYAGCAAEVLGTAVVSVCEPPDATIAAPATVVSKESQSASVVPAPGATYTWTIERGVVTAGQGSPNVTFASTSCSGSVVLHVTVKAACGAVSSTSRTVAVIAPKATLTGSTTIPQGSSATLQVNLAGGAPWTVTWSDGVAANVAASPYNRIVTPLGTSSYTVTSVTDAAQCAGTVDGVATVTVTPPAPANVVAAAQSPVQVRVTWTINGAADSFDVYRNGLKVGTTTVPLFVDSSAISGTAYRYHVVSIKSQTPSPESARDLATTVIFSGDPVVLADTIVEANHILELRTAVNAVRALSELPAFVFADASLQNAEPKAIHWTQLRSALDEARVRLGLPPTIRSGPLVTTGEIIWGADLVDLRGGVR